MAFQQDLFHALQPGKHGPRWSRYASIATVAVMLLTLAALVVQSTNWMPAAVPAAVLIGGVWFFVAEFAARLWTAPVGFENRGAYLRTPLGAIDGLILLFLLVPLVVASVWEGAEVLAHIFPVFVIFKIARYSRSLQTLFVVVSRHRRELWAIFIAELSVLFVASTAMYFLEREAQPEVFGTIPAAMWWGVVTLSTVGYGDATPITSMGQFVAGVVAMFGVAMFALPAGVLGAAFVQALRDDAP